MRIPKIFWSSKSDNFKSFKTYFQSFKWLEKVFYSSSFFCEFLFLISSHTEIPLTFTRECQLSISPPHPRAIATPQKWGPHRRTPKNIGLNFPLVMGCTRDGLGWLGGLEWWDGLGVLWSWRLGPLSKNVMVRII